MPSYYDILGVSKTASIGEIKSAFRRLAKLYHPDKNPGGKEMFEKILMAYEILIDSNRRLQYDLKLKYSASVKDANDRTARVKKKEWNFNEEELKRRQYYQEHYKKQYNDAKSKVDRQGNSKIYNEYKYILFATPLAVALLMFIIKGFEKGPTPKTESKTEVHNNTTGLKMGDSPYTFYFKDPVYDSNSGKVLKLKNPGVLDAIACLFTKDQKFIRSCFLQSGYYAELSQIPNDELVIKLFFGKNWNAEKPVGETGAIGQFDSAQSFYSFSFSFLKQTEELILDETKLKGLDKISEKEFFNRAR